MVARLLVPFPCAPTAILVLLLSLLPLLQAAQKAGHRVGVTGDGMNDAPALKNADVGVAMNSGSDAARDAAHVVLLRDDFAALVHAVRWTMGRGEG